jgi:lambda repressor-like predicted transcriptional regulator
VSDRLSGGQALKQAIHVARAKTDMTSDMALSIRAGVHYDTLMNWFGDRTVPRPHEVSKVAKVLNVPMADLLAAWEGRDVEPPPLQDAIRELIEEMRLSRAQQDEATMALLRAVGALTREAPGHAGTPADSEPAASTDSARS